MLQFDFLSFVTIRVFEFFHNLGLTTILVVEFFGENSFLEEEQCFFCLNELFGEEEKNW